ncbi:hypothetical protein GDO86_018386, partial [Hymenochirus boettgeri]
SAEARRKTGRSFFWAGAPHRNNIGRISIHEQVNRTEGQFKSLPNNQQEMLPYFLTHLDKIRQCIDHNQKILQMIVDDCSHMFENKEYGINVSFLEC